jgi:hypothetical protein
MDGSIQPAAFPAAPFGHNHVFLGAEHEQSERRTWGSGSSGTESAVQPTDEEGNGGFRPIADPCTSTSDAR